MFLLLFALIFVLTGQGQSWHQHTLTCHHKPSQQGLMKVWCKQSSKLCCSGFAFAGDMHMLEHEGLQVQQDSESFTVTVRQLAQGAGVYWCGLLCKNNTMIKLNELHLYPGKFQKQDEGLHEDMAVSEDH